MGKSTNQRSEGDPTIAALRQHLSNLLTGGSAHINFEDAIEGFPRDLRGKMAPGAPHTAWQLLEHMRIAQWDILEFSRNPDHVSPDWPAGYWPKTTAPPDDTAWKDSVKAFRSDLTDMRHLIEDPRADLFARVQHPDAKAEHTLLREALLVADHNAYHLGQIVFLKKSLARFS